MYVVNKLFKPLHYVRIRHSEKNWFDCKLPILSAFLVTITISYFLDLNLLGKDGLVTLINGILQILSGFYIASMAAVATFQKQGMDDVMDGNAPTLSGEHLTRRAFLTYLFGYLAFVSIAMYFAGGFSKLASEYIHALVSICFWIKPVLLFTYLFVIFNILYTTVLGMHFMIDKINKEKPSLNDNKQR